MYSSSIKQFKNEKMKKKIIVGVFTLAVLVVNLSITFQYKSEGYSFAQLFIVSNAQTETGMNFINDYRVEHGYCYSCESIPSPVPGETALRVSMTCECTAYRNYCYSGGSSACNSLNNIQIHTFTCEPSGTGDC